MSSPSGSSLDALFARDVVPAIFGEGRSSERPLTLWVGGQPGSGKTFGGEALLRVLREEGVARVIGDDLRRFLPGYEELRRTQPLEMPSLTAAGSGELVRRCIQYANERRLSIMLEGTWRDPVMILGAVDDAWSLGRRTHAVVVAVPPVVSRVSAMQRFYRGGEALSAFGRWTPLDHHDKVVQQLPRTVQCLAAHEHVEQFSLIDRRGQVLMSSMWAPEREAQVSAAFRSAFERPVTAPEAAWIVAAQPLIAGAHERSGIHDSGAVEAQSWLYGVASRLQEQFRGSPGIVGVELRLPNVRSMIDELRGRAAVQPTDVPRADRGERSMDVER